MLEGSGPWISRPTPAGLLPALAAFLLLVGTREAPGVILYRIGTPFTPAEKY